MKKQIKVVFMKEAEEFLDQLNDKSKLLFFKAFDKTAYGFKGDWFKKMTGADNIFEFRIDADKKFYRLFAFWDTTGDQETLIVCTHGIEKKSNKTPNNEIKKAEQLKKNYFSAK